MSEISNINIQAHKIEPPMVIDELSSTEYYIGVSRNDKDRSKPVWRIKRIWKIGNVWQIGFPNGNQDFTFIWDSRYDYTYL